MNRTKKLIQPCIIIHQFYRHQSQFLHKIRKIINNMKNVIMNFRVFMRDNSSLTFSLSSLDPALKHWLFERCRRFAEKLSCRRSHSHKLALDRDSCCWRFKLDFIFFPFISLFIFTVSVWWKKLFIADIVFFYFWLLSPCLTSHPLPLNFWRHLRGSCLVDEWVRVLF